MVLSKCVSILVVVVNIGIEFVNRYLIGLIGYNSQSKEAFAIMMSIFISMFLNTSFLVLLLNANTEGTVLAFLPLRGQYRDLTAQWYNTVSAQIVQTMIANIFIPVIRTFANIILRKLMIFRDRGYSCR
jgi:hypothetical protein